MLNKPGASAITTAKPRVLWIAKMFGDDVCFCFLLFCLSSFPKVVVGNPLLSIKLTLFVITTDPRQKHSGMTIAFAFLLVVIPERVAARRARESGVRRCCFLTKLRDPRLNSSGMTFAFAFCSHF